MMSRRSANRRAFKKRGILPSFGDIVLPIVSIAAVGLLILAGRQFFINGLKTSPGMTSTRAYADSPAIIAEKEKAQEISPSAKDEPKTQTVPKKTEEQFMIAVAENEVAPPIAQVKPAVQDKKPVPAKKPEPVKKSDPPKKTTEAQKKPDPIKASSLPANKQWRVQTSSYPTKKGAEDAVKKINRAGFKATVYKNPASKYYKVWVQGGESKYQAGLVVNAMKKLGYKTSFAFPPSK